MITNFDNPIHLQTDNRNLQIHIDNEENSSHIFRTESKHHKHVSILHKKKQQHKKRIRRQYLNDYFSKKRTDLMNNQCKTPKKKYYNNSSHMNQFNYVNFNTKNQQFQEIPFNDQSIRTVPKTHPLQPSYSSNYLESIILLQQLIQQSQQFQQLDYFQQDSSRRNFKYHTFYDYVMNIISKSLDPLYFDQFNDDKIFQEHFNTLKQLVYNKLKNEITQLLSDIDKFNKNPDKKGSWAFCDISLDTCNLMINQLWNFMNNIQDISKTQKYSKYPQIPQHQQYQFLLTLFIQITYYDQPLQKQFIFQEDDYQDSLDYQRTNQNSILHQIQAFQDQPHSLTSFSSMTQYIVYQLQILNYINRMISFKFYSFQNDFYQSNEHKQQIKQKIMLGYLNLLQNIMKNIGSDELYANGIIEMFLRLSKQSPFNVNIRRQTFYYKNINNINHYVEQKEKYDGKKSLLQYKMKSLVVQSMVKLTREKNLKYLTQMGSIEILVEILDEISNLLKEPQNCIKRKINNNEFQSMFNEVESNDFYQSQRSQNMLQNHQYLQYINYRPEKRSIKQNQQNQQATMIELTSILAEQCIRVLKHHFQFGQYLKSRDQLFQIQNYELNNLQNSISQYYDNIFRNNNITLQIQQPQQNNQYEKLNNGYVVKFRYILNSEEILRQFKKGRELLEEIQ